MGRWLKAIVLLTWNVRELRKDIHKLTRLYEAKSNLEGVFLPPANPIKDDAVLSYEVKQPDPRENW